MSWLVDSKHELLFGTDTCVKLCDIRESQSHNKLQFEDSIKGQVLSIKFDPFDSHRFAALTDMAVKIFDIRNQEKPLFVIGNEEEHSSDSRQFGGFEWAGYRANLIATFMKKSSEIRFWDLTRDASEMIVDSYRTQSAQDEVASISWTPKGADTKDKYVVYTKSGLVEQKTFSEESKFLCNMSARGHIVMSSA